MLHQHINPQGVATLTLNCPERHNAFDDTLIAVLTKALRDIAARSDIRLVVLAGSGASFCAGADLSWMRRAAQQSHAENENDAFHLAELMRALDDLPQPSMAVVQGAAYGGGAGLIACCDMVLASETATFCFSEVKLGLIPAVISPYVVRTIGPRQAKYYFLTGEKISAIRAKEIGLVHDIFLPSKLEDHTKKKIAEFLIAAPNAQRMVKTFMRSQYILAIDADTRQKTIKAIADCRSSAEGQEGLSAFLEKRMPSWRRT